MEDFDSFDQGDDLTPCDLAYLAQLEWEAALETQAVFDRLEKSGVL